MTPDPKRSKETVKQSETRESNALPGESPERKKVRFLSESGDGGAAAVTVEELVEDYWSDEHGQGQMFEGLHCKVEPDWILPTLKLHWIACWKMNMCATFQVAEGAGMKQLTTRSSRKRNNEWEYKVHFVGANTEGRSSGKTCLPGSFILHWTNCGHPLAQTSCAHFRSGLHGCSPPGS